jgi:hypothetical protein
MKCTNCGEELRKGSDFCSCCGAPAPSAEAALESGLACGVCGCPVAYGDVYCRAPQGGYYKTTLGTRCDIHCQKGYELQGSPQVICQSNKRWSDKVICKRE